MSEFIIEIGMCLVSIAIGYIIATIRHNNTISDIGESLMKMGGVTRWLENELMRKDGVPLDDDDFRGKIQKKAVTHVALSLRGEKSIDEE